MSSRILVLISGSGSNLQALLDASKSDDYPAEVVAVLSNKADAYGLTRAENAGVDTITLSHTSFDSREDYDQVLIEKIDAYDPDLVVLAGFMRILTPG